MSEPRTQPPTPVDAATTTPRRRAPARARVGASFVASAVLVAACVFIGGGATASAATTPASTEVRLELTGITGTRIARGSGSIVRADVANAGDSTATGVTAHYQLPPDVDFDPATSSPGCTVSAGVASCPVGTIAPGATAPVTVGLSVTDRAATFGTRSGFFLAPTSDQFDPAAGEVRILTWNHEAGAEGAALADCWPVDNPSPNMDIAAGACDGINDAPALSPDDVSVVEAFPPRFAASVVRSWQFDTEFTAPSSGQYRACGILFDDGGYVAVAPAGQPIRAASVVAQRDSYGTTTSAPFALVGGSRYRLMVRVSNRGPAGVDNGATGGNMAGWDGVGIAPAAQPCGLTDAAALGTAPAAWRSAVPADAVVAPANQLRIAGAVEADAGSGRRLSSARIVNVGPDAADTLVSLELPIGAQADTTLEGCDTSAGALLCRITAVPTDDDRVVSLTFTAGTPGARWSVSTPTGVDTDPTDNAMPQP